MVALGKAASTSEGAVLNPLPLCCMGWCIMHMAAWSMTSEREAADMDQEGLWAAPIGTWACRFSRRQQVHPRHFRGCMTATLRQVQDCMWCCIWEALILCCDNGGATEHAHLPTQVRDAHVPVKFSSLASVVSQAEAHQEQGPSIAPPLLAACSRHRQPDLTNL